MIVADLTFSNFRLFVAKDKNLLISKDILRENVNFIVVMLDNNIVEVLDSYQLMWKFLKNDCQKLMAADQGETFSVIKNSDPIEKLANLNTKLAVVVDKDGIPIGVLNDLKNISEIVNRLSERNRALIKTASEYEMITKNLQQEIFVTDGKGYVLFLNPEAEKVCGVKAEMVVGKHVSELKKEKVFSSSCTLKVLQTGKKVNIVQKLKNKRVVLGTGMPIYNDAGQLFRILSTSSDVKEINLLMEELTDKRIQLKRKNNQLKLMQEGMFMKDNFVCHSEKMNRIKQTIIKIAPTDLTVTVQGESGVGKGVVAKLIHFMSSRSRCPFVKINCSLIPENLVESELFGYEGGSFTGANTRGKVGKIELANKGTLFFDEIGEMPLSLQVKLLDFLQDKEIVRVGGTKKIKIDTRVIVATNRNLLEMVEAGKFREDLFYRLNVLPITIPPLRDRKEDIPALIEYFLDKFNNKYETNKKISPKVENSFLAYHWPGNVRELEHLLERLIVISDSENITEKDIQGIFHSSDDNYEGVICTELLPLKKAKNLVEAQLVKKAYSIYRSTYKAGEILEVDQSTVVRLLKKHQ